MGGRERPRVVVSVEITSSGVRALKLRHEGSQRMLAGYEWRPLPRPDAREARSMALPGALREIAALAEGDDVDVRVVAEGRGVLLRNLQLPPMPREEIAGAVRFRWQDLSQEPIDQMCLDIASYGTQLSRGTPRTEVLIAAMDRAELDSLLETFAGAGLTPRVVIPYGVALTMLPRGEHDPERMQLCLDIGGLRTTVALVKGGRLVMAREIDLGGHAFTHALERELAVSTDEAEKLKILHGLAWVGTSVEPGIDDSEIAAIRNTLQPIADRLVREVKRSVGFVQEERGERPVERILLAGGGAQLRGLDRLLSEEMEAPVEQWRPLDPGVSMDPPPASASGREAAPAAAFWSATCLGAAWDEPPVNLLSPSRVAVPREKRPKLALWAAAAYPVILAAAIGWLALEKIRLEGRVADQKARVARILAMRHAQAPPNPALLARAGEAIDFGPLFTELDRLVPGGLSFESLALLPRSAAGGTASGARMLRVEGKMTGDAATVERTLARFLQTVENSPAFRNVQLVQSTPLRRRDERGLSFAFTCEIERPGPTPAAGGSKEEP
jgi:type IV pilus assembly protein PilM